MTSAVVVEVKIRIPGKFIISFIICTVLLSSISSGAVLLDRIVATVNDEVITWSELMGLITMEGRQYLRGVSGDERKRRIAEMERPFLNNLIEMKLQLQAAGKMGLSVSDDEVDAAIADIRKKFDLTDEAFMESLRSEMISMKEYRRRLREQILLQKVVNFAVRASIVVSDEEIDNYLKEHEKEYLGEEKMHIRQIFFKAPGDEAARRKIEEKAAQIYQRIVSGEDFASLAKLYSEGPAREFGGDIGYISRGSALKELEDTALALKVGEVSRPFWSRSGLHIIKLEEKLQGGDIDMVKENIKKMLSGKKFEERYHNWISELRESANIEIRL